MKKEDKVDVELEKLRQSVRESEKVRTNRRKSDPIWQIEGGRGRQRAFGKARGREKTSGSHQGSRDAENLTKLPANSHQNATFVSLWGRIYRNPKKVRSILSGQDTIDVLEASREPLGRLETKNESGEPSFRMWVGQR